MDRQACKVFVGGLSWSTDDARLRSYMENFGTVLESFVSYDRYTGRPRGFGFVVFESPEVADKVVGVKHTIDRREVEAKRAVPKEETPAPAAATDASQKTRKIFVGGLAPSVDEQVLRQYFEQFGGVDDAVVMYDHDNKRPRGFGFITFADEEAVDKVFSHGAMQNIHDKQIEIKPAVPRDQMPPQARRGPPFYGAAGPRGMGGGVGAFPPGRGGVPPFGFRPPGGLAVAAAAAAAGGGGGYGGPRGGGPSGLQGYPHLTQGAVPSPRGLPNSLGPGSSPRSGGFGAGPLAGGQLGPYGQQQQQQQRFSASGGLGGGSGGGRFGGSGLGVQQQPFPPASMYGSLGFGGGGGLAQPGSSPSSMGMYNISGLQQLQASQQQQQQQGGGPLNGFPGQLDISKLGSLAGGAGSGAAAAAAAAMAAKGYGVQGGLGSGAFPGFGSGQQGFGGQADAGSGYGSSDPAAAAAAAAAAGYGADPVGHLPGTSPLGTTPEFASFGAAGAGGWGS